jgi:hypothetical protein
MSNVAVRLASDFLPGPSCAFIAFVPLISKSEVATTLPRKRSLHRT